MNLHSPLGQESMCDTPAFERVGKPQHDGMPLDSAKMFWIIHCFKEICIFKFICKYFDLLYIQTLALPWNRIKTVSSGPSLGMFSSFFLGHPSLGHVLISRSSTSDFALTNQAPILSCGESSCWNKIKISVCLKYFFSE